MALAQGAAELLIPRSLRFRLGASLQFEYNSNITAGTSSGGSRLRRHLIGSDAVAQMDDFITSASVNLGMLWQFGGGSTLGLDLAVGYEQYLTHPEFSGLTLNARTPGGGVLHFATGEVHWTLHDHFSFSNEPTDEPELTGVTQFGRFTNSAGIEAAWLYAERFLFRVGYDRDDLIWSTAQTGSQGRASDSLRTSAVFAINAVLQAGLAASATVTRSTGDLGSDVTAYSAGPFLSGQITRATEVFVTLGVQRLVPQEGNDSAATWYANIRLNNQLTPAFAHSLDLGRTTSSALLAESLTRDYLQYSATLRVGQRSSLVADVFVERGQSIGGISREAFERFGGEISLQVALRPTIAGRIGWQHVTRLGEFDGDDYSQNRLFASASWLF